MINTMPSQFSALPKVEETNKIMFSLAERVNLLSYEDVERLNDNDKNLKILYVKFNQALLNLPAEISPDVLAEKIYAEMIAFNNPQTNDKAFISFDEQISMLQNLIQENDSNKDLSAALNIVLIGTVNAQSQMTTWMQDIIMSGGESEESTDW